MARQPDIQYIQFYNYGSTAPKRAPRNSYRKEKYQLPEHRPMAQKAKHTVLDPLSVCAIVVAGFMLITMLVGMFRVGELTSRRQELEGYISVLQQQNAELELAYEQSYDLTQVEQRARQMGLVSKDEVAHVQMGPVELVQEQTPSFADRFYAFFDELFAKAPR